MSIDRNLAAKAHKLQRKHGYKGKALGLILNVSTEAANTLAAVGSGLANIEAAALTASELLLLRVLANEERLNLDEGVTRSCESKVVSWRADRASGWCAATVGKRLFVDRWDEKEKRTVHGLGFVHLAGNGYVWLTPTGWALVLAVEAAEAAVSA